MADQPPKPWPPYAAFILFAHIYVLLRCILSGHLFYRLLLVLYILVSRGRRLSSLLQRARAACRGGALHDRPAGRAGRRWRNGQAA